MAGTKEGALKVREIILTKYGDDFYKIQGSKGGKVKNKRKGFGSSPERARKAGMVGGKASKRKPAEVKG